MATFVPSCLHGSLLHTQHTVRYYPAGHTVEIASTLEITCYMVPWCVPSHNTFLVRALPLIISTDLHKILNLAKLAYLSMQQKQD